MIVLCLFISFSPALAFEHTTSSRNVELNQSKKIYLPKDNLVLSDNQILVGKGDNWISVYQLSADEKGFYVLSGKSEAIFQWECPKCGHDNWFWDDKCYNCGYRS